MACRGDLSRALTAHLIWARLPVTCSAELPPAGPSSGLRLILTQLTCRQCRPSTGTGCPAAMLSVNQLMSSRAGRVQPGGGAGLLSCQRTAASAEVCSITTCVTSELGGGKEPLPGLPPPCFTPHPQAFPRPGERCSLFKRRHLAREGRGPAPPPGRRPAARPAARPRTCRRPARGSPWRAPGA